MTRNEALLEQLRRYEPADELETRHYRAIVDLLTSADGAFSRGHFEPGHITAGCFIVDPAAHRLLLHHHRRLGRWLQMGGHVEPDEPALDAALREASEESGLTDLELLQDGIFDVDVHGIPAGKGEPDHRHFDIRYAVRTRTPERIVRDPNESNDLAWVPLAEAEPMMNEEASSRALRKLERLLS